MCRLIIVSALFSLVGFVARGMLDGPAIQAEGGGHGGGAPSGNGDVNADGSIDISDGIYILSWLFTGGPAPDPIECPPPAGKGLPATGQTLCLDALGNAIDCVNPQFPGQDAFYRGGCPMEGRFVDNGDGTVTDVCTGLMWQQHTPDMSGDGSIGPEDQVPWEIALQYCEGLSLAGHDDWRLPNVRELQSIVDYGLSSPAIQPLFRVSTSMYWSSSPAAGEPGAAWGVELKNGSSGGVLVYGMGHPLSVRF